MFKLKAIVKRVGDVQYISEKFSKRELVLEIPDDKFPQTVLIEFTNDKTALLDSIGSGQEIEVSFSLRGREWTNDKGEVRVFNTLNGFAIDGNNTPAPAASVVADDDDVPF